MMDGFARTPRYVLNNGFKPTFPPVLQASSDDHATVIFGFSGKPEYDVFVSSSSLRLTPYPLVKGFLNNQIEQDSGSVRLIVLNAISSEQPRLNAATFQAVLEAFRLDSDSVAVSHRLVRDESSSAYRIETSPSFAE